MSASDRSEEVLKLIGTVERLPREDQVRILRIVDLLSMASTQVQRRTQRMLSDLLEGHPESKSACVAGVDEVIAYLEDAVYDDDRLWRFDESSMIGNA
ncbi:MAG TPA: hypothetical protein VFV10_10705 [Gammaproteobacteria bacterium]|nr:hypothetical protein [Gammaproteobacteria bacterium]